MEREFIYWRHPTPVGIKVEEVSGGEDKNGRLWRDMAMQVYAENGKDGYREIGHFANGAPFIVGSQERISISHTPHLLVVATLPEIPDANLAEYSPKTALGVDVERADREKARDLRERFLNDEELRMIPSESVEQNVTAWTIKEAVYKAGLTEGIDFRKQIQIVKMPEAERIEDWLEAYFTGKEKEKMPQLGQATLFMPGGERIEFNIYTYITEDYIVTLAYTDDTIRRVRLSN